MTISQLVSIGLPMVLFVVLIHNVPTSSKMDGDDDILKVLIIFFDNAYLSRLNFFMLLNYFVDNYYHRW